MDITINYDYREEDVRNAVDVDALARFVIEAENKPASTEVSINFVTDEDIHELNRDYRGIDRPTDVLSFECDGLDDDFDDVEAGAEGEPYELGDIVIAPDVAERQTDLYGTTFQDELSLLLTHGLLHLCGYDHIVEDEALVMEARERDLLTRFYDRPFIR
ncbi:MAG: rRNA maturation RNase YbeY [Eggerthellaceae bacterium]